MTTPNPALDAALSRGMEKRDALNLTFKLKLAMGELERVQKLLEATQKQHRKDRRRAAAFWLLAGALLGGCVLVIAGGSL